MEDFKKELIGSTLHSFRNVNQFLEAEFSSDSYEEIIFFIDCKMMSSNMELNDIVNDTLGKMDADVSEIAFFIPANNRKISSVNHDSKKLGLTFDNGYVIYFQLDNEYGEPLSISFKRKKSDSNYESINLDSSI